MRFFLFTLLLCLLFASTFASLPSIKVDPDSHHFVDENGQIRIFHGVNAVEKVAPWYPVYEHFDPSDSLSPADARLLRAWGMNVVRLGVMWPGVMPEKNTIDQTYLNHIEEIVKLLSKEGIYVILDMHQDLWERRFCGEGVPAFVADTCQQAYQEKKGDALRPFPQPVVNGTLPEDEDGNPDLDSCLETPFFQYYLTEEVSASFQCLYDNVEGLWEDLGDFWVAIARRFKGNSAVLGLELINEPWAGDYFEDPKRLVVPGYAERLSLQPMYKYLHERIREEGDDQALIFYEGVTWDLWPLGWTSTPGGEAYDDRQVISWHLYCPTASQGTQKAKRVCGRWNNEFAGMRQKDVNRLGGGWFLTEFGALPSDIHSVNEISMAVDTADSFLQLWVYWSYKDFHDLTTINGGQQSIFEMNPDTGRTLPSQAKVHVLSRPYTRSLSGMPSNSIFRGPSFGEERPVSYELTFQPFKEEGTVDVYAGTQLSDAVSVRMTSSDSSTASLTVECAEERTLSIQFSIEGDNQQAWTLQVLPCEEEETCACSW
jgi:endoglycosylceramidase